MHIIYQNVHQDVLFILFHWAMFIWGHIDAQISDARVLYNVSFWFLTDCGICHFCYIYCVHLMGMSSTYVLYYAMPSLQRCLPCTFVISVMISTSMQTRHLNVVDFRDLVNSVSHVLLLFLCHVNLMLQRDPCIFWDTSVRKFWTYGYDLSIDAPVCHYGVVQHVIFLLYFCYKCFLADCLHVIQFCRGCCSWSLHAMNLFLPWLVS